MRSTTILGIGSVTAIVMAIAACEDVASYMYSAQKWNADGACLEDDVPIEVVEGETAAATCPAACLRVGSDLFVSTQCPPLPSVATPVDVEDRECKAALAAAGEKAVCEGADDAAGEREAEDAAPTGDAAEDASEDAEPVEDAGTDARDAADG